MKQVALKERTHRAVRNEPGKDPYNQRTYGLKYKKNKNKKPKKSYNHRKRTLDIPEDMWKVDNTGKLVRKWKG